MRQMIVAVLGVLLAHSASATSAQSEGSPHSQQPSPARQHIAQNPNIAPPTTDPAATTDPRIPAFDKSLAELRALFTDKKFTAAVPLGEELVEKARVIYGERHFTYTGSLYNLGLIYSGANRLEDAARVLQQAFLAQHPLRSPEDDAYKRILRSLDETNKSLGKARDTGQFYSLALEKLTRDGQIESDAAVYYYGHAGQLMRYLAEFESAEKLLRHALATRRKISEPESAVLVEQINSLAGLLRARGNFTEAEPLYLEAIKIQTNTKGEWNASTGILLDNIAVMYLHMGLPEKAEPYQKRALAIIEKALGRESRSTGITLANLAELYRSLGRLDDSEPLFERAIDVLTKTLPPNHPNLGFVYDNLAGLYRMQGNNHKAYDTYLKAIAILKAAHGPGHPEVGVALNNIGLVLANLGRTKEAEESFIEAHNLADRAHGPDSVILATALGNLADIRITLGKRAEAKENAERAIALITSALGRQSQKLIFPMTRLAFIEQLNGNLETAFTHFHEAASIYELTRSRADTATSALEDSGAIHGLIKIAHDLSGQLGTSFENPKRRAAFHFSQLGTLTSAGDALSKLGARLGATDPALRKLARDRQDTASAWAKTEKALLTAVSAASNRRDATTEAGLRAQILAYQKQLTIIDDKLARAYPQFAELSRPRPVDVAAIRSKLATDEVLIQYLVTAHHTYAWAITTTDVSFAKLDLTERTLRDQVQSLRCGLDLAEWIGETKPLHCLKLTGRAPDGENLPFATDAAHALYEKLLQPLEPTITGRKLLVVGSDALTRLPLHILLTAPVPNDTIETLRNAPWLARRHQITVLPSVSSFMVLRGEPASRHAATASDTREPYLAIANPLLLGPEGTNRSAFEFSACPPAARKPASQLIASVVGTLSGYFRGGQADVSRLKLLEPLPDTATEVCAVARYLRTPLDRLLLGSAATETRLRQINDTGNGLERFAILHFATHGLVSGELRGLAEPALVLTPPEVATTTDDGLLSASEVAELKLNADWVILSACNTASGAGPDTGPSGDALSGLARSFFYAGARSLLVSHWPVRSDAAVALTTRAIKKLTTTKNLSRSAALQQAMLSVIADQTIEGGSHPQVWAPFVVVGEGTRLN